MNLVGKTAFLHGIVDFATSPELSGAYRLTTTEIDGVIYVFVASVNDRGVQVLRIENNELVPVFAVVDSVTLGLYGAAAIEVVTVGSNKYLLVLGESDDAINSFRITTTGPDPVGHLTHVQTLFDDASTGLSRATQLATANVAGVTYAVVAGYYDDAVTVFRINANGTMTQTAMVTDADSPNYRLSYVQELEVATVGGRSFIYTASTDDRGISAPNAGDGIATFTHGGRIFMLNAGQSGSSVRLYEIGAGEDVLVGEAGDDSMAGLDGDDHLIGQAGNDVLFGGRGDDVLSGGAGADTLVGGEGSDVLVGGLGDDLMSGGAGADIFVFSGAFGNDRITDFSVSEDRIDLSAVAQLNSLAAVLATSFTVGGSTYIAIAELDASIQIDGVTKAMLTADHFIF